MESRPKWAQEVQTIIGEQVYTKGMTVKAFLLGATATAIIAWLVFALVVTQLDPGNAGAVGFVLFFLVILISVASTAALIGYGLRRLLMRSQHPAHSVRPAIRQGIWLAAFLDILLFMQLLRLLRWWIVLIIVLLFLAVELIFISHDRSNRSHTPVG